MRRHLAQVTVAVAVAAVLAGCGDDGDSGVADYVKAAEAICAGMDTKAKTFNDALFGEGPPTAEKLQTWAGHLTPILEDGFGRLVALEPPETLQPEITKLNQAATHGLETLQDIARDPADAERALQAETDGLDEFRRQANTLGLRTCAGNDSPSS